MRALRNIEFASLVGLSFLAAAGAPASAAQAAADTILTHGEVYKADGGWAEALAISIPKKHGKGLSIHWLCMS